MAASVSKTGIEMISVPVVYFVHVKHLGRWYRYAVILLLLLPQMMQCPPVHQRVPWTQPLTVISDSLSPQVVIHQQDQQLPSLRATTTTQWETRGPQRPNPAPPSMRSRPLSAGARRPQEVTQRSKGGPLC